LKFGVEIMKKIVVVYSGGMDSFTLLNRAVAERQDIHTLSFDYGQKHRRELECATLVTDQLKIPHQVLDITSLSVLFRSSSLISSDKDVPEGHYESENMKSTVVPNRNMILLSIAIGYAVDIGADSVWYGAHAGDHAIYPDCRPEFVERMNHVAGIANYDPVTIFTPYLDKDKKGILAEGIAMGLDYASTWTCYKGKNKACGKCGSCTERLEAFEHHGLKDPLEYESNS